MGQPKMRNSLAALAGVVFLPMMAVGNLRAQQAPVPPGAPAAATSLNGAPASQSGLNQPLTNSSAKDGNSPAAADPSLTVPAGTKVLLSVESPINTKTARPGDGIYLVSTFPVIMSVHTYSFRQASMCRVLSTR